MNHFEAKAAIEGSQFASADFYRMQFKETIALGLQDQPTLILMDVVNHGSSDSKTLLNMAIDRGHVVEKVNGDFKYYDVVDIEDTSGAPYQFRSHIAMQIAYPDRYWEHYESEHVWNYSHPKMQTILELCFSCITNKEHPSDWFGEHEIAPVERKPGRPNVVTEKKAKPTGINSHTRWVAACQKHNLRIKAAWQEYMDTCTRRKQVREEADKWFRRESINVKTNAEEQIAHLESQIKQVQGDMREAIDNLRTEQTRRTQGLNQVVADALRSHNETKNLTKPIQGDFL